jgi:hypothetical protein
MNNSTFTKIAYICTASLLFLGMFGIIRQCNKSKNNIAQGKLIDLVYKGTEGNNDTVNPTENPVYVGHMIVNNTNWEFNVISGYVAGDLKNKTNQIIRVNYLDNTVMGVVKN